MRLNGREFYRQLDRRAASEAREIRKYLIQPWLTTEGQAFMLQSLDRRRVETRQAQERRLYS